MNRLLSLSTSLLVLLCASALSGCATNAIFPDTDIQPQVSLGTIKGSDYGGHAPIVGAHVFVLQAGTSGYGGPATSLLSATYNTSLGYATAQDLSGTAATNPTYGMYYITTDHAGDFNITGDYTCTQGLPVYVYASGGTSALEPFSAVTSGTVGATTATFTASNLFSAGQYVTFANFPVVSLPGVGLDTGINSISNANNGFTPSYQVTTANLTSFTVQGTGGFLATNQGATGAGTAFPVLDNNPAIANMAMLGVCSSTGNFSYLQYVYLNEVSTVAEAYAMAGFFSNSATALTSTDAVHMSIPQESGNSPSSPAWVGIQNAANNAAQLYLIQGNGQASTAGDGEGHIALATTPSGGKVPQSLIDGIANALAACVDSGNTATIATAPCTTLLGDALPTSTLNGAVSGTAPKDTATAAINLAHNPWNSNSTAILNLATGVVPYLPTVSSASDLTIGISYPLANQSGRFSGVAVDASGNAWVTSFNAAALTKFSPLGVAQVIYNFGSTMTPGDVAFDSKGQAWVAIRDLNDAIDGTYVFTNAGALVAGSPFAATGTNTANALADDLTVAVDGNDFIYFANHTADNALVLSNAGTPINSFGGSITNDGPFGVALDASDNLWMSTNITSNNVTKWAFGGNSTVPTVNVALPDPEGLSLDASGNVWISNASNKNLYEIKAGTSAATTYTGGGLNNSVDTVVDGSGRILVSSPAGTSNAGNIAVFSNSGVALTGSNGFTGAYVTGSAQTPMSAPYFIALDNAGDLWVSTNTTTVEYIGVATPVLTPLSAAVKKGTLAAKP